MNWRLVRKRTGVSSVVPWKASRYYMEHENQLISGRSISVQLPRQGVNGGGVSSLNFPFKAYPFVWALRTRHLALQSLYGGNSTLVSITVEFPHIVSSVRKRTFIRLIGWKGSMRSMKSYSVLSCRESFSVTSPFPQPDNKTTADLFI